MKKIAMIMLVFLITIASAFAVSPVASNVLFGDDNQERGLSVDATVVVTNYNTLDVKHIEVTSFTGSTKYAFSGADIDVTESAENVSSVSISAFVPLDFDAVDNKGKKSSFKIGDATLTVTYTDDTTEDIVVPLYMEAENLLEFHSDSKITIESDESKLRDGKSYADVKRDDEIILEIVIENKFDNNGDCNDASDYGDCDINDITVELEPDQSDFDDDSADFSDLGSDSTDTETLSFSVPDDVSKDDHDFDLYVTGTDENGALHGDTLTFTLEVDVPRDEVTITDAYFNPSSIDCDIRHVTLKVSLENTGTDDQNRAAIEIDSSRLDIKESLYNIELDEGDKITKSFELSLPDDVEPGSYYVTVDSFYDNSKESDTASAQLIIRECVDDTIPNDEDIDWEDPEDDSNTEVNIIEVPPSTGVIVGEQKEPSFFESNSYTLLLGFLFIIALLMFFIMLIVILKK